MNQEEEIEQKYREIIEMAKEELYEYLDGEYEGIYDVSYNDMVVCITVCRMGNFTREYWYDFEYRDWVPFENGVIVENNRVYSTLRLKKDIGPFKDALSGAYNFE